MFILKSPDFNEVFNDDSSVGPPLMSLFIIDESDNIRHHFLNLMKIKFSLFDGEIQIRSVITKEFPKAVFLTCCQQGIRRDWT